MAVKQLEFKGMSGWGGRRAGAGRKRTSQKVRHEKRPLVRAGTPFLITIRFHLPFNLRSELGKKLFARACDAAKKFGLKINHISLQSNHCHFIGECDGNEDLASSMRSFRIKLAKAIARIGYDSDSIGRYHLRVLKTPTEVKRAIKYVLLNICKHAGLEPNVDQYSSGTLFEFWRELIGRELQTSPQSQTASWTSEFLSPPCSWLGRVGWLKGA